MSKLETVTDGFRDSACRQCHCHGLPVVRRRVTIGVVESRDPGPVSRSKSDSPAKSSPQRRLRPLSVAGWPRAQGPAPGAQPESQAAHWQEPGQESLKQVTARHFKPELCEFVNLLDLGHSSGHQDLVLQTSSGPGHRWLAPQRSGRRRPRASDLSTLLQRQPHRGFLELIGII